MQETKSFKAPRMRFAHASSAEFLRTATRMELSLSRCVFFLRRSVPVVYNVVRCIQDVVNQGQ